MLLLFTKVRAFSFERDVKERSKASNKKLKSRSLRTRIKYICSCQKIGSMNSLVKETQYKELK